MVEKTMFIVRIWRKDYDHKWHYMGKKKILARNACEAIDKAVERYGLNRWPDYMVRTAA